DLVPEPAGGRVLQELEEVLGCGEGRARVVAAGIGRRCRRRRDRPEQYRVDVVLPDADLRCHLGFLIFEELVGEALQVVQNRDTRGGQRIEPALQYLVGGIRV